MKKSDVLLVCLSGRGDKDMGTVATHLGVDLG
jgi:tryptophan synthase beta subunit